MDRERLGRVLGKGTRLAARTALEAVDAATAASPHATSSVPRAAQSVRAAPEIQSPARPSSRPARMASNLRPAVAAARQSALAPLRHASRALWHELTGTFFALFALSFGVGAWHSRASGFSSLPQDRYRMYAFCALTLLFAYFSISSFVRARHRRPER